MKIDKLTGKKLVPLQTWVLPETRAALNKLAAVDRRTLKEFLRIEMERIARGSK